MAKLKSLSAGLHRQELIDAARRTHCYRSEIMAKTSPSFAACVAVVPCYVTIPTVVNYHLLSLASMAVCLLFIMCVNV